MTVSASFSEFVKEVFSPLGAISVRKMFGGAGVYCDELFFAIVVDDAVYLKADQETRGTFETRSLQPLTFTMKGGRTETMSYYNAPEEIFDDEEALRRWAGLALEAATRAAEPKKMPVKKKRTK